MWGEATPPGDKGGEQYEKEGEWRTGREENERGGQAEGLSDAEKGIGKDTDA